MPIDGVFIHHLTKELNSTLINGKINRIYQPAPLTVIIQIRANTQNYNLLLSSVLDQPRIHLTNEKYDNPQNPLNFCMILRKYIERGEIKAITQYHNDRLVQLHILANNELGDEEEYLLIIEVMGRNSNIILINQKNIIIDAIRKVPPTMNNTRLIIPKATYIYPTTNKINPFDPLITNINYQDLEGTSKLLINECLEKLNDPNDIIKIVDQKVIPTLFYQPKYDFYCFDLSIIDGERKTFSTLSSLLDYYYSTCLHLTSEETNNVIKVIKSKLKSCRKKEDNLLNDLSNANNNLKYIDEGVLLQAYLYLVKKGDESLTINNFLTDNSLITLILDPLLEPSENLKVFFNKGKKAKKTLIEAEKQLILVRDEIDYLEDILYQLDSAVGLDLLEIKDELINNGYLKKNSKNKKNKSKINSSKTNYLHFMINDIEILVGKNNYQNEYLTTSLANIHDYWFHVKDASGSHVIVRVPNNDPLYQLDETIIRFSANLAAYYSSYRLSSSVPVNYTKVKYIKKIPGLRGYKVTFTNQLTIYIDPTDPLTNH